MVRPHSGPRLTKIPAWMLSSALVRCPFGELQKGSQLRVRAAAPSVVYVILEGENDGGVGRNGGLLPHTLPANGWEPREEKPQLYEKSSLAVYAKRVESGEVLELPEIADGGPI